MGLNGEDRRIRALFCELKREEQRISPVFAETWKIAEADYHCRGFGHQRLQPSSNLLRFMTVSLVVSGVLAATVLLPEYLPLRRQPVHDFPRQEEVAVLHGVPEGPPQSGKVRSNRESREPPDRLVAIRRSVQVKKSQVAYAQRARTPKQNGLSEWQSPTARLLRSTGDNVLSLVPQMNESAEEMKKFLSNDLN